MTSCRTTAEQIRKVFEKGADPRDSNGGLVKTIFGTSKDYDEAIEKLRKVYAELREAARES
jgi:hypothetical protein